MNEKDLLRCLVHIMGRTTIPTKDVRAAVGKGKNRVKAFNGDYGLDKVRGVW